MNILAVKLKWNCRKCRWLNCLLLDRLYSRVGFWPPTALRRACSWSAGLSSVWHSAASSDHESSCWWSPNWLTRRNIFSSHQIAVSYITQHFSSPLYLIWYQQNLFAHLSKMQCIHTCDGTGQSTQVKVFTALYRSSREVGKMVTTSWVWNMTGGLLLFMQP